MQRTLTVLTLAALALTGCASGDDGDPTAVPSQSDSATPAPDETPSATPADDGTPSPTPTSTDGEGVAATAFADCEAADYTVARPADWQTNEPTDLVEACRVFHPEQIDLPDDPQGIGLHWAVLLRIDNAPYEDVVGAEPTGEVLTRQELTIDGRDARVIEVRSDGEALVPAGESSYNYAVDLDGRTLFATTYTIGDTDYERDKQVVDRMIESLELSTDE